jgi:hypothetical protein
MGDTALSLSVRVAAIRKHRILEPGADDLGVWVMRAKAVLFRRADYCPESEPCQTAVISPVSEITTGFCRSHGGLPRRERHR